VYQSEFVLDSTACFPFVLPNVNAGNHASIDKIDFSTA